MDSLADVFAASSAVRVHSGNVHANTKIPNLSTAKDVSKEGRREGEGSLSLRFKWSYSTEGP